MTSAIRVMNRIQVGKEVTPGTLVAATRRLVAKGTYTRTQEMWDPVEIDAGVFARIPIAPVITKQASRVEMSCPFDFSQPLLPLLSGMVGAVTPTGAGADKTWTFEPSTATPPAVETYTVEYAVQSTADTAELEFGYGFTDQMKLAVTTEGVGEFTWSMWGRASAESTVTPALTVPTLQRAPSLLWKLYRDTTWAGLGGTAIAAQVYGFEWTYANGIHPGFYLDGRSTLDFSQPEYGAPSAELTLDVVIDPAAAAFLLTEQTAKTAVSKRFIQLEATGPALGGSFYKAEIDGCYYHAQDSMETRGEDRDGNPVVRMHFFSGYDSTASKQSRVVLVTADTAFP